MEIQDRNIMTQQVVPQKIMLFQSADSEGAVFADMLKSSMEEKNVTEPKIETNQRDVHEKSANTKTFNAKKVLPEKGIKEVNNAKEAKETVSKEKNAETKVQKAADENKGTIKEEAAEEPKEKVVSEEVSEEKLPDETANTPETNAKTNVENVSGNSQNKEKVDFAVENLEIVDDLLLGMPVFSQEVNIDVKDIPSEVGDQTPIVAEAIETEQPVRVPENQKPVLQEHRVKLEGNTEEMPQVMTKEELVLNEQARYLDEKASFGKKLKIDVNVTEEKVAASISKDVLKNRFEIDALVQSVDVETQEFFEEKAPLQIIEKPLVHQEQVFSQNNINVMPVVENEVNLQQFEPTALKETEVASVNAENVAETTKLFRQEILTRVNETSSRDNVRGMAKEVVEQIKINITKSAIKGVDTVEIQLKPEDLGKIQIKMHIAKDGKLHADIVASRAETLDILQKESSSLAEAFNNAGYEADGKSFSFSFQKENQSEGQQNGKELAQFLGEKLEEEQTSFENDNFSYDPLMGLNIRV